MKKSDSNQSFVIEEREEESASDMAPDDFDLLRKLTENQVDPNSLLMKRFQWRQQD
jgi:hypothetical protein